MRVSVDIPKRRAVTGHSQSNSPDLMHVLIVVSSVVCLIGTIIHAERPPLRNLIRIGLIISCSALSYRYVSHLHLENGCSWISTSPVVQVSESS